MDGIRCICDLVGPMFLLRFPSLAVVACTALLYAQTDSVATVTGPADSTSISDTTVADSSMDTARPPHAGFSRFGGDRASFRVGIHSTSEDLGFMLGMGIHIWWLAGGADFWIRPGVFTREVQTSPGRRAQYKELLYEAVPWAALEIPLGRSRVDTALQAIVPPWKLALVGALELSDTHWYGTSRNSLSESVPSVGVRIISPPGLQICLRRAVRPALLGTWRGDVTWAF